MSSEAIAVAAVGTYFTGLFFSLGAFFAIIGNPMVSLAAAILWPGSWLIYLGNWMVA